MARLTVSVVVGAEPQLVFGCIRSVLAATGAAHVLEIRVTCNTASPALISALLREFPSTEVRENPEPAGFATNHNRAVATTSADYFLIANDDVEFAPGSVASALEFLERPGNATVAALSPRLINADGSLQRSTYRFPSVPRALLDLAGLRTWIPHNRLTDALARYAGLGGGRSRFWSHDHTCDVDTFRGAAMLVRAAAWRAVGPFAEHTRAGGEVGEWHQRCRKGGWRVVFFADATVLHYGSRTVGRDRLIGSEYLKGYLVYFARHRSRAAWLALRTGGAAVATVRLALAALIGDRIGRLLWRRNLQLLVSPPPGTRPDQTFAPVTSRSGP